MITLAFILTMPGVGSWNGQWSSAGDLHAVARKVSTKTAERLKDQSWSYDFGDGWRASVEAREIAGQDLRKLRKNSQGFCGYDWMIDSIIYDGDIYGPTQPKPNTATQEAVA